MTKIIGWAYHAEHYTHAGIISEMAAEGDNVALISIANSRESSLATAEECIRLKTFADNAKFPETEDSEYYPQPVFADQIEAWDDQAIDKVNPGDAPDYKTWGEVY